MTPHREPVPTIFVACHQSGPHPGDVTGYRAVCNRAEDGTRPPGYAFYDDLGYPDLNGTYCELSVLKDLDARIGTEIAPSSTVGLVHYRRMFVTQPARAERYYDGVAFLRYFDWARPAAFGASAQGLAHAAADLDWVTAPVYDVRLFWQASSWEHLTSHHPDFPELMQIADRVISDALPHGLRLSSYLKSTPFMLPFNMFITRAEHLRRYCRFLWPLLESCVTEIGLPQDPGARRYAGYLAEHLHGLWLDTVGAPAGLRVGHLPAVCLNRGQLVNSATGAMIDRRTPLQRFRGNAAVVPVNNAIVRRRQLSRLHQLEADAR